MMPGQFHRAQLSMAHLFASKNKYKRKFRFEWTGFTLAAVEGKKPKDQDHHHGLSQGNPLSPLLFILVMDIINLVLAKVTKVGLLQPLSPRLWASGSMYSDEVVLCLSPVMKELEAIQEIINWFGAISGLKTKINKCSAKPSLHSSGGHWYNKKYYAMSYCWNSMHLPRPTTFSQEAYLGCSPIPCQQGADQLPIGRMLRSTPLVMLFSQPYLPIIWWL